MAGAPPPEQRLLSIAAFLLKKEEPVSWERIREEFRELYGGTDEAAERKWTRDKADLLEVGVPIEFVEGDLGTEGGYVIAPEAFRLRDLRLTPDEAAILWTAAHAAARMQQNPWRRHVLTAIDKLRTACRTPPSSTRALPVRHGERADRARLQEIVDGLGDALRRRKRVTVEYFTASRGETNRRDVDVYGFAWRRGVWLFAGHCHLRGALRVFYVDHVRSLQVNRKKPADHDYEIPPGFDIATFSRQQPWDYWVHEPLEAEVRVGGALSRIAGQLLPGARLEPGSDAVVARLTVRNLPALVRAVLSFGPEAELLAPEQGRALAREMLDAVAERLAPQLGRPA